MEKLDENEKNIRKCVAKCKMMNRRKTELELTQLCRNNKDAWMTLEGGNKRARSIKFRKNKRKSSKRSRSNKKRR